MKVTSKINIALATTVFTLSSLTYFALPNEGSEENARILILPLLFFGMVVVVLLICPKRWPERSSFWVGEGAAVIWLVPLFTFLPSLCSTYEKSFRYWILDSVILILCRLYSIRVPLRDVLEGLFWSGIIVIASLFLFAGELFLDAINTLSRFNAFGFHPNTLAFIMGTFFAVSIWQVGVGAVYRKILGAFAAVACLLIIFFASSRGSLVAAVVASFAAVAMFCVYSRRLSLLWGIPVLLCLAVGIVVHISGSGTVWESLDQVLQISEGDRGIGSGMSGRLTEWYDTWTILLRGSWIYGNGVRASDNLTYPVDNGFLVLLYDFGIVPFLLIVGRYLSILRRVFHHYFAVGSDLALILFFLLFSFLLNNLTARFLFGVGNPSSLFAVMLFASPWIWPSSRRFLSPQSQVNPASQEGTAPA